MSFLPACVLLFASYYADPQQTASGEFFDGKKLTMAIRDEKYPIKRWYFVTYKNVTLTVWANDRGPFVNRPRRRDVDLSGRVRNLFHSLTRRDPNLDFVCVSLIPES